MCLDCRWAFNYKGKGIARNKRYLLFYEEGNKRGDDAKLANTLNCFFRKIKHKQKRKPCSKNCWEKVIRKVEGGRNWVRETEHICRMCLIRRKGNSLMNLSKLLTIILKHFWRISELYEVWKERGTCYWSLKMAREEEEKERSCHLPSGKPNFRLQ